MAYVRFSPEYRFPSKTHEEDEEDERGYQRHSDLVSKLPEDECWLQVRKYQGFWMWADWLPATLAAREHFVARPNDIFLTGFPKCGNTWLQSMVFSVVHRGRFPSHDEGHPLQYANPHELVPLMEHLYIWCKNPDLSALPSPRIFASHCPYSILPESIKAAGCRIIHVAREPKDTFVSLWHFCDGVFKDQLKGDPRRIICMDDAFDKFCTGISHGGPIWEHVLEYWKEHLRCPDQVLFLKYEALRDDPVGSLRTLAAFLGCSFSADEEKQGLPDDISRLCSFESLSNLKVNTDGALQRAMGLVQKKLYFRRAEVGDWVNHLTLEMAAKLDKITNDKLHGSDLNF